MHTKVKPGLDRNSYAHALCVCVCVRAVSVSVCLSSELRFGIVTGVREFLSLVMESTGALSKNCNLSTHNCG